MKNCALPAFELQRRDLLDFEPMLCASLRQVLDFTAHGIYFPKSAPDEQDLWLPKERKLFVPLRLGDETLGVFIAHGVSAKQARSVLPLLPGIVGLCLENLHLRKQNRTDQLTGLALKRELLDRLVAQLEGAQFKLAPAPGEDEDPGIPLARTSLGLITIKFETLAEIARVYGHVLADDLLAALAEALRSVLPAECLAARAADDEIAVMIPTASRGSCEKLASAAVRALEEVNVLCPLSGRAVRVGICLGFVLYPQDMSGADFKPNVDIARLLLQKARLAASAAGDRAFAARGRGGSGIMGFSGIIRNGGVVLEQLPMGRVFTSLGRDMGARPGLRFSVWTASGGETSGYVGEIELRETGDTSSMAEVCHLNDPARPPRPGDCLELEHGGSATRPADADEPPFDPSTGLSGGKSFFERYNREADRHQNFALAILRVECGNEPLAEEDMAFIAESCRYAMGAEDFAGRHGVSSLIVFHNLKNSDDIENLAAGYRDLCVVAEDKGLELSVGLAAYPFLQYHRSEMADCCRKAMDFALLLPRPRVGIFGSLAINISADRIYSGGDIFGAMEEYKIALLADKNNAMAWNSLGVCLAALSHQGEAMRYFKEALIHNPGDPATLYNLGVLCQSMNETRSAARHFRACIKSDPAHLFAYVRLGQLAEQAKRLKDARGFYSKALAVPAQGNEAGRSLARRCLARVARKQNKTEEARALLYEILLHSPADAAAMAMLAGLFLDNDESPDMAEMLARQSIKHQPSLKSGWQVLARALKALGREDDAALAAGHF